MRYKILSILIIAMILMMTGCSPYQGKITVGKDKETQQKGSDSENVNGELSEFSDYDGKVIEGEDLHAFIDKYSGNPEIAIVICTNALGGAYATKGESYVGNVGYNNLPMVYIMDELGMIYSYGINYNAQYTSTLKIKDGKLYDEDGFQKDNDGNIVMYTNFEDAGIDPGFTEHLAADSKFDAKCIRNKKGQITGIYFSEKFSTK